MRYAPRLAACVVAVVGLSAGSASAAVVFQDDFEALAVGAAGPTTPLIGQSWVESATSGTNGVNVVGSPALGTRSIRFTRESAPPIGPSNGSIKGLSIPGALVPGNVVEVKWSVNIEHVHRFNGPMQVSLGHKGSQFNNQLAFIQISDVNATPLTGGGAYGYYQGPGHFTGGLKHSIGNLSTTPRVRASLNTPGANEGRWDHIRAVLTIAALDATHLTGTMDLFVDSADDTLGEIQIADDSLLETTDLAHSTIDPLDVTSLQLHFAKGSSSGLTFIDNVSATVTVVPEPSSLGLVAALTGMLVCRNRK